MSLGNATARSVRGTVLYTGAGSEQGLIGDTISGSLRGEVYSILREMSAGSWPVDDKDRKRLVGLARQAAQHLVLDLPSDRRHVESHNWCNGVTPSYFAILTLAERSGSMFIFNRQKTGLCTL